MLIRLEVLFFRFRAKPLSCPEELDVVDWDHRLRFPTPSFIPVGLPGRDQELLLSLPAPESNVDSSRATSCGPNSSGLLGLVAERGVRELEREEMEAAFLTVTTDEEVELVLDDFRRWDCPGPEEFIV
jgi:hypothetical protein